MPFRPSLPVLSSHIPPSSRRWLARQFKDPLVRQRLSDKANYRSRSAYKLIEIDAIHKFLKPKDVRVVVDLGAAPGGWSQVVSGKMGWKTEDVVGMERTVNVKETEKVLETEEGKWKRLNKVKREAGGFDLGFGSKVDMKSDKYGTWSSELSSDPLDELGLDDPPEVQRQQKIIPGQGTVIAVDLLPISAISGVKTLKMDFLAPEAPAYINALLPEEAEGKVDVILSDMAANFSGNRTHDIESSLDICHAVFQFAQRHLRTAASIGRVRGGVLLLKNFAHPLTLEFRNKVLQPNFHSVLFVKPVASRSESSEGYWLCRGWKPIHQPV